MTPYLEISFRHGRPFAAYLHCSMPGHAASSRQLTPSLILDFDEKGVVLGLEITDPLHVDAQAVAVGLLQFGIHIPLADLSPLAA